MFFTFSIIRIHNYGGEKEDAFHVVCPSLPGYGFSSKPSKNGTGVDKIAILVPEGEEARKVAAQAMRDAFEEADGHSFDISSK